MRACSFRVSSDLSFVITLMYYSQVAEVYHISVSFSVMTKDLQNLT
jgi:hypothetical protein